MARWSSGTRARLQTAALELFAERGYAETTVAAVAARAGVTERTYFRHFRDKREVLFAEDAALLEVLLEGVARAPAAASAWEKTASALRAVAEELEPRRSELRVRARVLASDPDLRERDTGKQAGLVAAVCQAVEARGADRHQAALAAAVGGGTFAVVYAAWLAEPGGARLAVRLDDAMGDLRRLVTA